MISRWQWLVEQITGRLWFRAGLYAVIAVVTALVAAWLSPLLPDDTPSAIGADAVGDILTIIASSMLAVATFSLSTMVQAFAAAAQTATPRATRLLIEDSTAQNALATFIGAFLFGLVGIIALSTGAYGPGGRLILFVVTDIMIGVIVVTFLRWIDHLSRLGRVGETIDRVECATLEAVELRRDSPHLGGEAWQPAPASAIPLLPDRVGYIQHLDMAELSRIAGEVHGAVYVASLPGSFVDPSRPLAWLTWTPDEEASSSLREAFLIGTERSFKQDPRFGLIVLSEIASRALSPGINDPGTAIDVIGRAVRVLTVWAEAAACRRLDVQCAEIFVPSIAIDDAFDDIFTPIARDGAGIVEVGIRLQKALVSLSRLGDDRLRASAQRHSRLALKRSDAALGLEEDRAAVAAVARCVDSEPPAETGLGDRTCARPPR